jgi:DNA anti-recombination protein RmuC
VAELETAADRALARVTVLKEQVHDADDALDALDEAASRLDQRLDEEADALRTQVERLQRRAVAERERIERETEESVRSLDGAEESARTAAAECDREAARTREEIAQMEAGGKIGAGRVAGAGRTLSEALAHLEARVTEVEGALAAALRQAADEARAMDVRLREMAREVEERAAEVLQVMDGQCPELVARARQSYIEGLDRIDEALADQLESYEDPLTGTCEEACTHSAGAMEETYPQCEHDAAVQAVSDLALAVLTAESEIANVESEVSAGLESQLEKGQAAIDSLDVCMEVLASHGYV